MAFIWTSKTRGRRSSRTPDGRTFVMAKSDGGQHVATERQLERRLQRVSGLHLGDPQPIPGVTYTGEDK